MNQTKLTSTLLEQCAESLSGPVALTQTVKLIPAEGEGQPFFPPTYAETKEKKDLSTKYQIDELSDGTLVAQVDSVGAQANRMEPIFKREQYRSLVPQIDIEFYNPKYEDNDSRSIFDVGHRIADAVFRCTSLHPEIKKAFIAHERGNSEAIAKLAPTTLVFGAWDSRSTLVKIPRLLKSIIRAYDVSRLTRRSQYLPPLDYKEQGLVPEKSDPKAKSDSANRGFVAHPSARDDGGIIAHGGIYRTVDINLRALRRLESESGKKLREYILGLALVAATADHDLFLRQGCNLTLDPNHDVEWTLVYPNGTRETVKVSHEELLKYAAAKAKSFGVGENRELVFDKKLAIAEKDLGLKAVASKEKQAKSDKSAKPAAKAKPKKTTARTSKKGK